MDIQGQWLRRPFSGGSEALDVVARPYLVGELDRGGIRGVSGTGPVVAGKKLRVHLYIVQSAHLNQANGGRGVVIAGDKVSL